MLDAPIRAMRAKRPEKKCNGRQRRELQPEKKQKRRPGRGVSTTSNTSGFLVYHT
jgi:hypothetical protein